MDITAIDQLDFHFQQVIEHFGKVKKPFLCCIFLFINLEVKIFICLILPIGGFACDTW
jgi:hypothetical protein